MDENEDAKLFLRDAGKTAEETGSVGLRKTTTTCCTE
jgi:hypothetical protein